MPLIPTILTLETINSPNGDIVLKAVVIPVTSPRPIAIYAFDNGWALVATVMTDTTGIVYLPFYTNGQLLWSNVPFGSLLRAEHIGGPDSIDPATIYTDSASNIVQAGESAPPIPWMWIAIGVGAVAVIGVIWYVTRKKSSTPPII